MTDMSALNRRLSKAKTSLILEHPFIGAIALNMPFELSDRVPTAATNGKRVVFNPEFIKDMSDEELKFLTAHEVFHPMLEHNFRRGERNHRKWNRACVSLDTLVLMADGTERSAGEVRPGDALWSPFGPSIVYECLYKGLRPVVRLAHNCGTAYATYDHKFLRDGGWNATVQGDGCHEDFYAVPRSARVCQAELPRDVYTGIIGSYRGSIPQCGEVHGDEWSHGRQVLSEATVRGCSGVNDGYADSVSSRHGRRRWDNQCGTQEAPKWESIHTSVCDSLQHVHTVSGMVGEYRVSTYQTDQYKWSPVLDLHLVGVPVGYATLTDAPTLGYQEAPCPSSIGAYLAKAEAIKKLAATGAYAAYCEDAGLAKRTQVIARGEDTPREVVDFVTSQHVFIAGGLVSHNCDYVINELLTNEGVGKMPSGGLQNTSIYNAGGGTSDGIYNILEDQPGDDGSGGYADGNGPFDDCEDAEGSPAEQAQAQAEMKIQVAQAAQAAKMMGKMSANMQRLVDEVMQPKVNWRDVLRRFVEKARTDERTWARPNRRFISQGIYLPSVTGESMGELLFAVDCSGSIDQPTLNQFAAEIRTVKEDCLPVRIHVVYFDSEVSHYESYAPEDDLDIKPHGGGGTAFSPVFRYAEEHGIEPVACVFLTDLYCYDFGDAPDYPVLWVSNGADKAPFGEVVSMV